MLGSLTMSMVPCVCGCANEDHKNGFFRPCRNCGPVPEDGLGPDGKGCDDYMPDELIVAELEAEERAETSFAMSAAQVAEAISAPVAAWPGNCFAIATAMVDAGLCPPGSVAVYGHWTGPVHPRSMFYSRSGAGFCNHGWVLKPDGTVIDPTRFVFEMTEVAEGRKPRP